MLYPKCKALYAKCKVLCAVCDVLHALCHTLNAVYIAVLLYSGGFSDASECSQASSTLGVVSGLE